MLRGVIFDLDGVIVNSHPIHVKAWKKFLASVQIVAADSELEIIREGKNKTEILQHFLGKLSEREICIYAQEKDRLYREEAQELTVVKGIRRLLDELGLGGISIAVASSGSLWRVHQTLDLLRLRDRFTTVVTGSEFKTGKSDSAIFLTTAQRMRVRCEESLVFEDSPAGVRSATTIGMKCLGIADNSRAKALLKEGAERVFPNFIHVSLSKLQALFAHTSEPSPSHSSDLSVITW
jgi:HAD superfamily hydrolase (TIGR01509 family)